MQRVTRKYLVNVSSWKRHAYIGMNNMIMCQMPGLAFSLIWRSLLVKQKVYKA